MIEVIQQLPDHIAGFHAEGRVTSREYKAVVLPTLREKLEQYSRINVFYDLDDNLHDYDLRTLWMGSTDGLRHYSRWHHVALVTDSFWIQNSLKCWSFFTPKYLKLFYQEEKNYALNWVSKG